MSEARQYLEALGITDEMFPKVRAALNAVAAEEHEKAHPPQVVDGVLYGRDAEAGAFVNAELGSGGVTTIPYHGLSIIDDPEDGRPSGVVCAAQFFNHRAPKDGSSGDITVAIASTPAFVDRLPAFRTSIRQMMAFPFEQLGLGRITAEIDLSNERVVRAAEHLGFRLEGKKRRMGRGGGQVGIYGLLKDEARTSGYWHPVMEGRGK